MRTPYLPNKPPIASPASPAFMARKAAMAENRSGAPFPNARKVTPCLLSSEIAKGTQPRYEALKAVTFRHKYREDLVPVPCCHASPNSLPALYSRIQNTPPDEQHTEPSVARLTP